MPVDIEPRDLGLPPRFSTWRPGQLPALYRTADAAQRFIAGCMSTGTGKSVFGVAVSLLFGVRTCIATSTKLLQDQYTGDFAGCGMVDIRGAHNYRCSIAKDTTCADGRLMGCKSPTCPRAAAVAEAKAAQLVITNYPCYLHSYANSEGLGEFGMLILDEAHSIVDELCSFLEIQFAPGKYEFVYDKLRLSTCPHNTTVPSEWRKWAGTIIPDAKTHLDDLKQQQASVIEIREADRLHSDLTRINGIGDDWIIDAGDVGGLWTYTFSPLWPTAHAERLLFRKVPKVILLSATIVRKTLDLLAIPVPDSLLLNQASGFDPNRAPVYLFGPSRIDYKASEGQLVEQAARMDMLISRRLDRKSLIHTISYDRQRDIVARSQFANYIMAPASYNLASAVAAFRESPAPRLLASPALTTGYDFKYTEAECQYLLKMLFIDGRGKLMQARAASDPDYLPYLSAQNFQQTCGRIMRAPDDRGETVVLDAHAHWFVKKHKALFTAEFMRRVRYSNGPPQPPPALESENIHATQAG
jgi:Rad3-related DNA helicase